MGNLLTRRKRADYAIDDHDVQIMSMMMSEKRPRRRRSVERKSDKRIKVGTSALDGLIDQSQSAKKAARPELCKNEWEEWTKERYAEKLDLYSIIQKVRINTRLII